MPSSDSKLTRGEQQVLEFIHAFHQDHSRVPSARQICHHFGYRSTRAAQKFIEALRRKGAVKPQEPITSAYTVWGENERMQVPILGSIAAGAPLTAFQDHERSLDLPEDLFEGKEGQVFALEVVGDSMLGDHICHGDIALISQQESDFQARDIVAVRVASEEFTLKRVRQKGGHVELHSSNPQYPPIKVPTDQINLVGRFIGLLRRS